MTFKIYIQTGGPRQPVRDLIRKTHFLFFNHKTGEHQWRTVQGVATYGVPAHLSEVEFESWEQVHELLDFHPEVKRAHFGFVGYRDRLVIGKTDRWTSV